MNADLRGLVAKLPSLATLDAVDDDALSGLRPCPLDKFTIADVRLLHTILSVAQGQEWRPIESVPKSAEVVLFYLPNKRIPVMCRADDYGHGFDWVDNATHWQPLPAAPAQPDGVSK